MLLAVITSKLDFDVFMIYTTSLNYYGSIILLYKIELFTIIELSSSLNLYSVFLRREKLIVKQVMDFVKQSQT